MKKKVFFFIFGIIVASITTNAMNLTSDNVGYTNSKTSATNVKGALDDLYNKMPDVKIGTFTRTTAAMTVTLGFKPKYLAIVGEGKTGTATDSTVAKGAIRYIYNADHSTTHYCRNYRNASEYIFSNTAMSDVTSSTGFHITSTGFYLPANTSDIYNGLYHYFAVSE